MVNFNETVKVTTYVLTDEERKHKRIVNKINSAMLSLYKSELKEYGFIYDDDDAIFENEYGIFEDEYDIFDFDDEFKLDE